MNVDGKTNVKKRIKIFDGPDFITYKYVFENGNYYNDTVPKWKQRDFGSRIYLTPEEKLENQLDTLILKR
jgi:hypothetical protein